jgi:hypothetical protein
MLYSRLKEHQQEQEKPERDSAPLSSFRLMANATQEDLGMEWARRAGCKQLVQVEAERRMSGSEKEIPRLS